MIPSRMAEVLPPAPSIMDNIRFLLFAALVFVGFLLYQAWIEDYHTPASTEASPSAEVNGQRAQGDGDAAAQTPHDRVADLLKQGDAVVVETDLYRLHISTVGGDIRRLVLLQHRADADHDQPYVLLSEEPERLYVFQGGLLSPDAAAPDHHSEYRAARQSYRLDSQNQELVVPLTWSGPNGLEVIKEYVFRRDSYQIEVRYRIVNGGGEPWTGRHYSQFHYRPPAEGGNFFLPTYSGAGWYDGEYHKLPFEEFSQTPLEARITGGWAAIVQHYFLGAVIGDPESDYTYYSKTLSDNRYLIGLVGPALTVAPGETATTGNDLFLGPKAQDRLGGVADGLALTVDYGFLTILSEPLFWALWYLHRWLGNWGWAIVVLTLGVRAAMYPLAQSQFRSMAKMRQFAPRIQALKERYGEDRQKLNEAMIDLYRKEKFNPLGGCLPLFIQLPVFIALYWVLLESVELRHAGFVLWIDDLSSPDPYYVLPIVFGVTTFIQQKLSATPAMDPIQQRMMNVLPIGLAIFFTFFPAGLVLYWTVSNIVGIAQQWVITRRIDAATAKAPPAT